MTAASLIARAAVVLASVARVMSSTWAGWQPQGRVRRHVPIASRCVPSCASEQSRAISASWRANTAGPVARLCLSLKENARVMVAPITRAQWTRSDLCPSRL